MKKKALVIGGGSLRGAYSAGVITYLGRKLGSDYFDKAYACSVGVYMTAFFLAGQTEVIEDTWRHRITGGQLVNYLNFFKGRNVLDLEYLEDIFSQGESRLDLERLSRNRTGLEICLTDSETGNPTYVGIGGDLLRIMSASCAYPLLHPPVSVNGKAYFDGGISDPLPVRRALDEGHEEVFVILPKTKPKAISLNIGVRIFRKFIMPYVGFPPKIMELIKDYEKRRKAVERELEDPRFKVIRPSERLPLRNMLDTNYSRINESFDIGVRDAVNFLGKI